MKREYIVPSRPETDRVELFLPMPPSVNAMFGNRKGGRYKTPVYAAWIEQAGLELLTQRPGRVSGKYEILIQVPRIGTRKGSDVGNREKAISDLMTKLGVITDDSYCERIIIEWRNGENVRIVLSRWNDAP